MVWPKPKTPNGFAGRIDDLKINALQLNLYFYLSSLLE